MSEASQNIILAQKTIEHFTIALQGLQKVLEPLTRTTEQVASKKTEKGSKLLAGMMGAVADAATSGAAEVITGFVEALNPLTPIIETLNEIFGIFGDIMKAGMMPAISQLYEIMLTPEVMDAFLALGKAFGEVFKLVLPFIEIFMTLLVPVLKLFTSVLSIITPIIEMLIEPFMLIAGILAELLVPVIELLAPLFEIFLVPLMALMPLIKILVDILKWLMDVALEPFIHVLTWLGKVFKWLADAVGYGIASLINWINAIVQKIDVFDIVKDFGVSANAPGAFPRLGVGGIVTGPTLAVVGEKGAEAVIPLDKLRNDDMLDEMERTRKATEKLVQMKIEKGIWEF